MNIFIEPVFSEYYRQFPITLVDIGASGGLKENWTPAKKYLTIVGFEPDEREFINLKTKANQNTKYINSGLYKKKTALNLYLTRQQKVSSIFKPNFEILKLFPEPERFEVVETKKIEVDTLDNQFEFHAVTDADFIKIDTQGSELFILEGATETMQQHVFGLEIEVEFTEIYQNQPLFSDVDSFVRKQGFQLFDIQRYYWKKTIGKNCGKLRGQLVMGDALYLRKTEEFVKVVNEMDDPLEQKSKIVKAISICLLYGYVDYALELLNASQTLFQPNELQTAWEKINKYQSIVYRIPYFIGKHRIADVLFRQGWELLQYSYKGWAIKDRQLGNL